MICWNSRYAKGDEGGDYFAADKAWWYITLITMTYLVSRVLAKAANRSAHYDDGR